MANRKYKLNKDGKVEHFLSGGQVGSAASSALAGAGTGAALGSVVPGIGTAIGAIGGGLIGGISSLLGSSGTPASTANLTDPVTGLQLSDQYNTLTNNQNAQQTYLNQLQAQNGVQNQSNVYNQYGQIAAGQGPNPAQALLNQQTGTNVANQAALMASQRGAGANPALIARQAAQQGAATQQNAVGQAASLQAQQQLAALNAQAGIAGQQVGQVQSALGQQANTALGNQGQLLGAQGQFNATQAGGQASVNAANTPLNVGAQQATYGLVGGALNSAGGALAKNLNSSTSTTPTNVGGVSVGSGSQNLTLPTLGSSSAPPSTFTLQYEGGKVGNPKLNQVPSKDRFPSSAILPPHMKAVATIYHPKSFGHREPHKGFWQGGMASGLARGGGPIPGEPKYPGNNKKNDVVPAMLSKGEIVLPNTVTKSKDPVGNAAKFVAAIENKKYGKSDKKAEFRDALKRSISRRKAS